MATTGKKGKKNKGKTLSLTSFHAEYSGGTGNDSTTVVVPKTSWADEMDDYDDGPVRKEQIVLPTAPRAARGPDISDDRIPRSPPFTAYIANLSYDVTTDVVMNFFKHLKIKGVRLPRDDGPDGRLKGFGYADFEDRESLIEALTMNDQKLQHRNIKIDLATQHGRGDRDGDRRGNDRYGGRGGYGEEQGEEHKSTNWRSDPPPANRDRDDGYGDRRGGDRGFDRYEPARDRYGDDRRDRGYGRDRYDRDERGYDRYDRNDRYGGRGDRYGDRNDRYNRYDRRRSPEPPRERQKLNLQKRTVPADEVKSETPASSSSIFGGAKPVDTAKKEAEIERKLQDQQKKITLPSRKSESEDSEPKRSVFGSAKPIDTSAREREVEDRLRRMDIDKKKVQNGREEPDESGKPKGDIFGSARPVDTSAREREVEERLRAREQERDERRSHDGDRRDIHSERRGGGRYNRRGGRGGGGGGGERRDHHRIERRTDDKSPPPMKKLEEKQPNFVGSNKFSSLQNEDDVGSDQDSN